MDFPSKLSRNSEAISKINSQVIDPSVKPTAQRTVAEPAQLSLKRAALQHTLRTRLLVKSTTARKSRGERLKDHYDVDLTNISAVQLTQLLSLYTKTNL